MRICQRFIVFCLTISLAAAATLRPLTVKEVSLMLRAGFSNDSLLRDLAARGVVDSLDEPTRKTMLEFGASPELLRALEAGQFKVSDAAATRAKMQSEQASAAQEQEAEKVFRNATTILRQQHATAAAQAAEISPLMHSLGAKLVRWHDDSIQPAGADEKKKLVAIYFSAHWCPPCRKFTPQLVDFYNRVALQHPEFELIFYSFDHNRSDWENYLREDKMPWPAIDYDQVESVSGLQKICGDGIPSLVLLDGQGQVICDSYINGHYAGPQKVVDELEKRFAGSESGPAVSVR